MVLRKFTAMYALAFIVTAAWSVVVVSSFHVPSSHSVTSRKVAAMTADIRTSTEMGSFAGVDSGNTLQSVLLSDIPRDEEVMDIPVTTNHHKGRTDGTLNQDVNEKNKPEHDNNKSGNPFFRYFLEQERQRQKPWWSRLVPPPPEDQFIMTGDICVLFLYAFTSHSLNDWIVNSVLRRNDMTVLQAVHSLDPTGEVVNTQIPSWVQTQNQLAVDHVLSVNAQETLLNHWGPLFSTEGSACVALCTCWLIAGWLHRAFLFQNSVDCTTDKALSKTVETWLSTCVMMIALAMAANAIVEHIPALQTLLCVQCAAAKAAAIAPTGMDGTIDASSGEMLLGSAASATSSVLALTKADTMFLVDSVSVLIAWRFMANRILNTFR